MGVQNSNVLSERKCIHCNGLLWVKLTKVGKPSKQKKRCTVCAKLWHYRYKKEWRKTHTEKPRNWGNIRPETRAKRTHICQHCGNEYLNKRNGGEGKKYCSRQCAFAGHKAWMRNAHPPRSKLPSYSQVEHTHCVVCGTGFYNRHGGTQTICSKPCDTIRYGRFNKQAEPRDCKECGLSFTPEYGNKRRTFCSGVCAKKHGSRMHRQKYGNNHRTRARHYGVDYEPVNKLKVFERDGWRCQVCGVSTPQSRQGTRHPNAPELDHRVALAAGGAHSYDNTQCACRQCNSDKGAHTTVGQLPMFVHNLYK